MLVPTSDRAGVVPLTVEQYHRMIEQGILPEGQPIELLDGQLVPKNRSAAGEDPTTVGHEPDGAIVIGLNARYRQKHPAAADVLCVVEVADSSLQRDRTQKLRIYAAAGIAKYVIINLFDRAVEVYTDAVGKGAAARYRHMETSTGNQLLDLPAARGKKVSVAVRSPLP